MSKLNTFRDEKAYNYGWIEKVSKFTSKVLTVYLANSSEKDFKKGWISKGLVWFFKGAGFFFTVLFQMFKNNCPPIKWN